MALPNRAVGLTPVESVRSATKCPCGKCKTCQNRRYSAEWRKRHPGPAKLTRVRKKEMANGSMIAWVNLQGNSAERASVASATANHHPGRFADWSRKRLAELRNRWGAI